MKELILTLQADLRTSVELIGLTPDKIENMSLDDIRNMEFNYGRKKIRLEEMFDIEMNEIEGEPRIVIKNSNHLLKHVGEGMTKGEILIEGDVGMYVGAFMKGGKIVVYGNADNWAGQNMKGGELIIKGDAQNYIGSSYRGDWRGMSGGTIIVEGNAGNEIGEFMLKGLLHVKGNTGLYTGIHLNGGFIIVDGNVDIRVGAEMIAGAIVVNGKVKEILPSFKYEGIVENPIIKLSKKDQGRKIEGVYYKFTGDYGERKKPKGQLYINVNTNPGLV